jgi:hypothetical protein
MRKNAAKGGEIAANILKDRVLFTPGEFHSAPKRATKQGREPAASSAGGEFLPALPPE